MGENKVLKGWEVLKMIDEWDENTDPIHFKSLMNDCVYRTSKTGSGKGLKNVASSKTRYKFTLQEDWVIHNYISVGDWVVAKENKVFKIYMIDKDEDGEFAISEEDNHAYDLDTLRKATPEEIEQELERRKWQQWGREVNEWKIGDIFRTKDCDDLYRVIDVLSDSVVDDMNDIETFNNLIMVVPVEMRVDM